MSNHYDSWKDNWDDDDNDDVCEFGVPLLQRPTVCQWRLEKADAAVPDSVIELNPSTKLAPNSFALEVTPEEQESNPGLGQYVFIQTGDIIDKRVVAIVENAQTLGLWVIHRCQDTDRWFIQPNKALPPTFIEPQRIVGRVVQSLHLG